MEIGLMSKIQIRFSTKITLRTKMFIIKMAKYKKFTHLEHILARPDTYVGSLKSDTNYQWVVEDSKMIYKEITWVPGLYKIFDEILVNAIDQCSVDQNVDTIKVNITKEYISVFNNGMGIPIKKQDDVYIPEMIFGQLLTSSNYDDTEERTTGGRNGYGAKLTNVFSTKFCIDIGDLSTGKRYIQEWSDNMTNVTPCKITKNSKGKGYVKITFYPDFEKFKIDLTDEIIQLFSKRVYDTCACTTDKVKVYLNDKLLNIKSFEKYTDLYTDTKKVVDVSNNRWKVCVTSSESYTQVSFVNGIATTLGGSHVDSVLSQLIKKVTEYLTGKHKDLKIKPGYIKDHLFIFVRSTLINPSFSSQTKEECTSRYKDFGSRFELSDDFVKKVCKLGIIEDIVALARHKENRELNKTDGRKKITIKGIPKLEDANKAGTSQSDKCTLILTEGDSAKTFAISGLGVVGRDYYGVFPLKGKLLNVRDASLKQLLNNEEINNIKQIVGLQQDKEYKDVSDLRYGKIMILTDADVDGSHIKGLFINFIHHFWPSLMNNNFLSAMRTPIIKAKKGNQTNAFYTKQDYDKWLGTGKIGWTIKYYKGLGTSTATEAKEYFRSLNENLVQYKKTENSDKDIELAFKKTMSDERKTWLTKSSNKDVLDKSQTVSFTDFIHKDLIWFSIADNIRSIPNMVDGLKPSQRKVLYACRKRQNTEIKVSQLAGYISTETCYHHGEQSLMSTVINMAQDYTGSNNINLLEPIGQFGTRLMGGKDAASPRYIFTKLSGIANKIFDKNDDPLLKYLEDDGTIVEPEYYVPVLPMVLINGSEGIGTGFSTYIPSFSPQDIIDNLKRFAKGKSLQKMKPWFKNFTGKITTEDDIKYTTYGVWSFVKDNEIEITELPIGKWISDYKEFIDNLLSDNKIKGYTNHSTETNVHFRIHLLEPMEPSIVNTFLKLSNTINLSNMHLFDENHKIVKYNSPEDILKAFAKIRLEFYQKRKDHLLNTFNKDINEMTLKMKFIELVENDKIQVFRTPKNTIKENMLKHGFAEDTHEDLLSIKLSQFTKEKVEILKNNIKKLEDNIQVLTKKSTEQLWLDDFKEISK